jgi:hypothetical protein
LQPFGPEIWIADGPVASFYGFPYLHAHGGEMITSHRPRNTSTMATITLSSRLTTLIAVKTSADGVILERLFLNAA